jgi:hypothetical protein
MRLADWRFLALLFGIAWVAQSPVHGAGDPVWLDALATGLLSVPGVLLAWWGWQGR